GARLFVSGWSEWRSHPENPIARGDLADSQAGAINVWGGSDVKQPSTRLLNRLTIFGTADERTIAQMENCLAVEEGAIGILCADNHLGYSQPIGAAVAYREHISPSGVGFDIGCGNKAVLTNL